MLELVGWGSDAEGVEAVAAELGGRSYRNHPTERDGRPYSAMIRVVTDEIEAVRSVSDVGLHVCFAREIKPPTAERTDEWSTATFGLVRHPDLTHRACDDHWRDVHGPLALRMHLAMSHYEQLSVVATLHGEPLDGIALCTFPTRQDLSQKFFNDDDAKAAIIADVSTFSDPKASTPRVVLQEVT